jgi:hypothetical protein
LNAQAIDIDALPIDFDLLAIDFGRLTIENDGVANCFKPLTIDHE